MHEAPQPAKAPFSFIVLMASLISIVAISIDALLPALGYIAQDFSLSNPNHVQYVVGCIFLGLAIGELVCGPLSDAWGRKPVLYLGLGLYLIGSIMCYMAGSFEWLLIGRTVQGLGVAGPYISAVSIVRDKYSGRHMAQVMSVVMMIFILVPAIAPALGQGILFIGDWRDIFILYMAYSISIVCWLAIKQEETLPKEHRMPFRLGTIGHALQEISSNTTTLCYTLCMGLCFGSFFGYLNASQQIFQVQFETGEWFTAYFGGLALVLGLASLSNSRIVVRLGMRYICIRAMATIVVASLLFLALHAFTSITLVMFLIYAAVLFFCFGLMFGNLNAIAMEPMGHIAGTASAVMGATSSIMAMILGAIIGQLYAVSYTHLTLPTKRIV